MYTLFCLVLARIINIVTSFLCLVALCETVLVFSETVVLNSALVGTFLC